MNLFSRIGILLITIISCIQANAQNKWDIKISLSNVDCSNNTASYNIGLKSASGMDWTLGDQNYRLFFDGDLMTVTSVSSLLSTAYYGPATIDQNVKINGAGQETASPLDDIDDNLGFLDFYITQINKGDPTSAIRISSMDYIEVAQIEVVLDPSVIDDYAGAASVAFYHSRPETAGGITAQYTTLTENDAQNSTVPSQSEINDDLNYADGDASHLDMSCPELMVLDVKVFLEGPLSNGVMSTVLNNFRLLPGEANNLVDGHPYASAPWNHTAYTGNEYGKNKIDYPSTVVDWIMISIRADGFDASDEVYRAAALLHSNGTIEIPTAEFSLKKNVLGMNNYIVIEHRNHLAVISPVLPLSGNTLAFDFTAYDSGDPNGLSTYGGLRQKLVGSNYAMYSGNPIQATSNNRTSYDGADLNAFLSQNGNAIGEYRSEDFDLNLVVDGSDFNLLIPLFGRFGCVPWD